MTGLAEEASARDGCVSPNGAMFSRHWIASRAARSPKVEALDVLIKVFSSFASRMPRGELPLDEVADGLGRAPCATAISMLVARANAARTPCSEGRAEHHATGASPCDGGSA